MAFATTECLRRPRKIMPDSAFSLRIPDRREFLRGALAGTACCMFDGPVLADPGNVAGPGLHELARAKNLFFGCSIEGFRMADDPAYAGIVAHECGAATPEGALQWKALQPVPGPLTFSRM